MLVVMVSNVSVELMVKVFMFFMKMWVGVAFYYRNLVFVLVKVIVRMVRSSGFMMLLLLM